MSLRTRLILSHTLIVFLCLTIVAAAVSAMLQSYRDRFVRDRLDDISRPISVQVRQLVRAQASADEIWSALEE